MAIPIRPFVNHRFLQTFSNRDPDDDRYIRDCIQGNLNQLTESLALVGVTVVRTTIDQMPGIGGIHQTWQLNLSYRTTISTEVKHLSYAVNFQEYFTDRVREVYETIIVAACRELYRTIVEAEADALSTTQREIMSRQSPWNSSPARQAQERELQRREARANALAQDVIVERREAREREELQRRQAQEREMTELRRVAERRRNQMLNTATINSPVFRPLDDGRVDLASYYNQVNTTMNMTSNFWATPPSESIASSEFVRASINPNPVPSANVNGIIEILKSNLKIKISLNKSDDEVEAEVELYYVSEDGQKELIDSDTDSISLDD